MRGARGCFSLPEKLYWDPAYLLGLFPPICPSTFLLLSPRSPPWPAWMSFPLLPWRLDVVFASWCTGVGQHSWHLSRFKSALQHIYDPLRPTKWTCTGSGCCQDCALRLSICVQNMMCLISKSSHGVQTDKRHKKVPLRGQFSNRFNKLFNWKEFLFNQVEIYWKLWHSNPFQASKNNYLSSSPPHRVPTACLQTIRVWNTWSPKSEGIPIILSATSITEIWWAFWTCLPINSWSYHGDGKWNMIIRAR